jgi:prepilin-type N-terminal cleavage/methylation domain-containing protein
MFATQSTRRRGGFTLIEMIVVITIILMITALGIAFLPRFLDNQYQTRAVDQLSQWLLTAKQRAKRDGAPTGIRILADSTTGLATQIMYIQQPEPYTAGTCTGIQPGTEPKTAKFIATSVDFIGGGGAQSPDNPLTGGGWLVQQGDYLEVNGGGPVYYIQAVQDSATLVLMNTQVTLTNPTSNYRIIRQPRRLLGEDLMTLPQNMVVDLSRSNAADPTSTVYSKNVPSRTVGGGQAAYEILFSPNGSVIGQGSPSGKILLWVRDSTKQVFVDPVNQIYDSGAGTLISVQIRTGFIAAHPIATSGDPYVFTEDGRSSGL